MSLRALASRLFLVLLGVLAVAGVGEFVLRASTALGLDAPLGDEHNPRFVLSSNRRLLVEMDPNDPHLNDG